MEPSSGIFGVVTASVTATWALGTAFRHRRLGGVPSERVFEPLLTGAFGLLTIAATHVLMAASISPASRAGVFQDELITAIPGVLVAFAATLLAVWSVVWSRAREERYAREVNTEREIELARHSIERINRALGTVAAPSLLGLRAAALLSWTTPGADRSPLSAFVSSLVSETRPVAPTEAWFDSPSKLLSRLARMHEEDLGDESAHGSSRRREKEIGIGLQTLLAELSAAGDGIADPAVDYVLGQEALTTARDEYLLGGPTLQALARECVADVELIEQIFKSGRMFPILDVTHELAQQLMALVVLEGGRHRDPAGAADWSALLPDDDRALPIDARSLDARLARAQVLARASSMRRVVGGTLTPHSIDRFLESLGDRSYRMTAASMASEYSQALCVSVGQQDPAG